MLEQYNNNYTLFFISYTCNPRTQPCDSFPAHARTVLWEIYCKPRTTSHDCSAGMTNTSDYFRAQITHSYIHTTIHSYMRPYTTTTPCLQW